MNSSIHTISCGSREISFSKTHIVQGGVCLGVVALVAITAITMASLVLQGHGSLFGLGSFSHKIASDVLISGTSLLVGETILLGIFFFLKQQPALKTAPVRENGEAVQTEIREEKRISDTGKLNLSYVTSSLTFTDKSSTRKSFELKDKSGNVICYIKIAIRRSRDAYQKNGEWVQDEFPIKEVSEHVLTSCSHDAFAFAFCQDMGFEAVPQTDMIFDVNEIRNSSAGKFFPPELLSELERLQQAEVGEKVPFILQRAVDVKSSRGKEQKGEDLLSYQEALMFNLICGRSDAQTFNSICFLTNDLMCAVKEHDNEELGFSFQEVIEAVTTRKTGYVMKSWLFDTQPAGEVIHVSIREKILNYNVEKLKKLFALLENKGLTITAQTQENISNNLILIQNVLQTRVDLTPKQLCLEMGAPEIFF